MPRNHELSSFLIRGCEPAVFGRLVSKTRVVQGDFDVKRSTPTLLHADKRRLDPLLLCFEIITLLTKRGFSSFALRQDCALLLKGSSWLPEEAGCYFSPQVATSLSEEASAPACDP
ncbi:hypothetical protein LSTR_LSTR013661 [Laodelphax striatellus]|uniref:Uncharacterized protein n=1 Tax=Laodelphax striatellus TaxID=195883 RepID=A0A482WSI7_LAOST|nr:hypothetical protein LSTR_LSTR013661 [Laodelphax striatellus]